MVAPTVVTVRAGVQFVPAAAASFQRAEADLGRRIQTNSTYRDWAQQLLMYTAWQRYLKGGPKPPHSKAIHPDVSMHCKGLALDSNEWTDPSFNAFMADRGWIRTAASDPTERHHFEYQSWRDKHINRPAGGGGFSQIEDDMSAAAEAQIAALYAATFGQNGTLPSMPDSLNLPTSLAQTRLAVASLQRYVFFGGDDVAAGTGRPESIFGVVLDLRAQVAALTAGISALAIGQGVDPDAFRTIIAEELERERPKMTAAVDAQLGDDFASVNQNVDDQPTEFTVTPK